MVDWKPVRQDVSSPFLFRQWMLVSGTASAQGGTSSTKSGAAPPAKSANTGLKGVVAGGVTGGIEICITYPTEYVKTQLQLDQKSSKGGVKQYDGAIDCVKKTVRQYGFFGLYRGLSVLLYGSIPKVAVRFGTFEGMKTMLSDDQGNLSASNRAFCGLLAGIAEAVFAVTPMETIKVKFINDRRSENPRFKGFLNGVSQIIKAEGFKGIYQGVTPTILKQGSNQAIRFFVMETLKNLYTDGDRSVKIPKYAIGFFGSIAGAASVYGNTPIDVVKTRMQGLEGSKYKNTLDCFYRIWKEEGFTAFYKGTVPRLARVCLDVAITFTLYETIMELFHKVWP